MGDSLTSDIRGAVNAGIDSCWFNPDGIENRTGPVPDYEIRSLLELKEILSDFKEKQNEKTAQISERI